MRVFAGLILAAAVLGCPSFAQDHKGSTTADIRGNWTFKAWVGGDCSLDGTALLGSAEDGGGLTCELTAQQVCGSGPTALTWTVRQSCSAERVGSQLTIIAKVEEFLRGVPTPDYQPDNFSLTIHNGGFMSGTLISYGSHDAEWTREDGFLS